MYQEQINAYFNDPLRQKQLTDAVCRLVAIRSVREEAQPGMPFGPGPRAALDEALALCKEMGFSVGNCDHYVGTADLNAGETALHILGHLDVVGEGTGWSTDPYRPVVKDGMLYGRGVSDDKGPVVAALFAMQCVRDLGLPLTRNVRLLLGTDEESGSEDIAYYYAHEPYAPNAFTPDADFPLINVEKGHYHPDFGATWPQTDVLPRLSSLTGGFRLNVVPPEAQCLVLGLTAPEAEDCCRSVAAATGCTFTVTPEGDGLRICCGGKNAHAASPHHGNNAITALLALLAALPLAPCESTEAIRAMHALFPHGDTAGVGLGIAQADGESGPLTLNLALMTLTEGGFTAKFDVRFPICATQENCKNAAEAAFAARGIAVLGDGDMAAAHCVPASSPFVQTLLGCYTAYTGETNPLPMAIGGGTYVHDIPGGVAFGCGMPGFDSRMHGADERIPVANLVLSCKIFAEAIAALCK